jgi:hypothetical protein
VIAYPAMLDVPRELVQYVGRLLAAERQARGTRAGTRALTCFYQALMVLVWFRKAEHLTLLGAGFGISRATAYRYRDEGVAVLAAQAQDLHTALRRVAADGWSYVILDGKLFDCDRLTETTISVKMLRGLRWQGERGFALLVGRWKTLPYNRQPMPDQRHRRRSPAPHPFRIQIPARISLRSLQ